MPSNSEIKKLIDEWGKWASSLKEKRFKREAIDAKFIANNAIALIGVRRSGKTYYAIELAETILKKKEKYLYINFEDPYFIDNNTTAELDRAIEVFTEYELDEPELLIFDEIQNIDSWERWIRKQIDLNKYQIIVTGSSAKLLSSDIASSLTGRSISYKVYPLSFSEFLKFKQNDHDLSENEYLAYLKKYITEGGFPEPTLTKGKQNKIRGLRSYFEDILHKDIVNRYSIRNSKNLYLIANYYLTNPSSLHSSHSVKKSLNINAETVADYSQYLKDAFLIFGIDRYHPNLKVQTRDAQKIYVIDTGLRHAIARSVSEDLGKLVENIVFIELLRRNKEIYYYKENQEVDFIITENFKAKQAIQVCFADMKNETTYQREIQALLECLDKLKLKEGLILTKNREEKLKIGSKKINMVPVYKWLLRQQQVVLLS